MRSRKLNLTQAKPMHLALFILFALFGNSSALADPWQQHEQRLSAYRSKLNGLEKEVKELIEHRQHAKKSDEIQGIITQLVAKHKELQTMAKDQREELLHVRFKHPEKGDLAERKYQRYFVKSLEDMESEVGLDGKLDQAKRKMQTQYGIEQSTKDKLKDQAHGDREPAAEHGKKEKPHGDRIILRK